jgi:hypothetical protein
LKGFDGCYDFPNGILKRRNKEKPRQAIDEGLDGK